MDRFKLIEILIEKRTGRTVNGKAVWKKLEDALNQCKDEDGLVTVTGEDNEDEVWKYRVELHRKIDEETGNLEISIRLLSISIIDKKTGEPTVINVQGAII